MNSAEYWLAFALIMLLWSLMQRAGKMPSARGWHVFLDSFNTRGGNIVILTLLTLFFYRTSLIFLYQMFDRAVAQDNSFALMGFQATTAAWGGTMGALMKTMTSDSGQRRATDPSGDPAARTTQVQTQTTTSKTELPAEVPAEEGGKHAE